MSRLLLLGGPPAVGKSTVAPLLADRLRPCAWLEADDLWRMSPTRVDDRTRAMVEWSIVQVLQAQLAADFSHVVLVWVLHRDDLIDRLRRAVGVDAQVVHLVATADVLRTRLDRGPARDHARALERLAQITALPHPKIDTSALAPPEVADRIAALVRRGAP